MRHLRSLLVVLAVSAWAFGPLAGGAAARVLAPTYQSSDPDDGAMLDHPPSEVTVTFSEPLDSSSTMSVFDECGKEIDSGPATTSLTEMKVGIAEKTPAGTWKVVYTAVGLAGATGKTNGSFEFMVHHGTPCKKGGSGHPPGGHHPPGKGKGNGNNNHGNHPNGNGGGDDDHGDHDGGMSSGSGSDHTTDHSSSSDTSNHSGGTHDSGTPMDHGRHDPPGGGHGKHDPKGDPRSPGAGETADDGPVAAGPGVTPAGADGEAMLIGLGLALFVGVLGGWLLRTAGGLAGPA